MPAVRPSDFEASVVASIVNFVITWSPEPFLDSSTMASHPGAVSENEETSTSILFKASSEIT
jgi:hypothetical protein